MNNIRSRVVTLSLRADTIKESDIVKVFEKWSKGLKGSAYILHDKDVYNEDEIEKNKIKIKDFVAEAEDDKPPHYHILLNFGNVARSLEDVAKAFNCSTNFVEKVIGRNGFDNMMAYLTHNSPDAMRDNKYIYECSKVKGFKLPDIEKYRGINDYNDFIEKYRLKNLQEDTIEEKVMKGIYTIEDVKRIDYNYYLSHINKLTIARQDYVNSIPRRSSVINFYIGASQNAINRGRIGKGLATFTLALGQLRLLHPEVDFDSMTRSEIEQKYIFQTGSDNVLFEGYDGQEIIVFDDTRGRELVKKFKGIGNFLKFFDVHPKNIAFNVKFGKIYPKSIINIVNSVQSYSEFVKDIIKLREETEDKTQVEGRFPVFISIDTDTITIEAQFKYLIGSNRYDFKSTFENDLVALVRGNYIDGFFDKHEDKGSFNIFHLPTVVNDTLNLVDSEEKKEVDDND